MLSLNVSGGNLAAANKQVTKAWASGLGYTADVTSVIHGGKHWIAKTTHTAGSTTEPGVGASYADAWSEVTGGSGTDDQAASEVPVTDAGLYYTGTDVEAVLQEIGLTYALKSNYLALTNTTSFTPSADYHPATKKYVDDSITAGGGYTDEQAQDAVGGMFTGNTETGISVTYDDATNKVNFAVDAAPTDATISTTDVTTNDATTTKHGWMPKSVAPASGMVNFYGIANGETAPTNKALFDATAPSTQAYGDSASVGTAVVPARRDHKHAMPSAVTDATISTSDVTTSNAGTTKHGWLLKATAPGAGLRNLVAIDNGETVYKNAALFDATSPSTQASGDSAAVGTAMTAARRDHKHAMPTIPNASSLSVDDLITITGVAEGSVNLGTFTGSTITDSSTIKTSIQLLETAVETKVTSGTAGYVFNMSALTDLQYGGAALIDDTAANGATTRLWSVDKVYDQLALKQGADADLDDLADGSLTGTKVAFADTDGLWTAANIQAALEEMNDSINTGVPNGTGAKVHWSQLLGVPAGFADGSDDGAGGTPAAITVADTTDTTSYVALFESATGDLGPKTDAGLTYNAGTGTLTATGFTGPLTGTASGNLTTSSTGTLTNKTLDVEGTENVITIVDKVWFAAAGCNNTTATSFYDLPTANAAAAACITGTNTQKGVLDFDAATDESGQVSLALPSDWSGAIDVKYKWLAAATSGNAVLAVQTSCVADAETDDPSWNTASTVTDAAKGTTLQTNDAAITGVTATGCAPGELMHLRFFRDADNGSDTMTGDVRLLGAEVTLRRAQ